MTRPRSPLISTLRTGVADGYYRWGNGLLTPLYTNNYKRLYAVLVLFLQKNKWYALLLLN
jgi:hypothetical protein